MNNGQDGEHEENESGSEAGESKEDGDENSTERNNKSNGKNSGRSGMHNKNGGNGNSDENEITNSEDGDEDDDKDGDREGRGIAVGDRNDEALHADPARILLPTEQLVAGLILMFGEKKSKLEARRKFQDRKWTAGESFVTYADD